MKTTREFYEELAAEGQAELNRHATSLAVIGTYRNATAVLFAQDVKDYGFETAMHIAMDECTRAEHEKMGTPISHMHEYRRTAELRTAPMRDQQRTQADYEFIMNCHLEGVADDDEYYYGIPATYEGFWTHVSALPNGKVEVDFYKKPVFEPEGWQQG